MKIKWSSTDKTLFIWGLATITRMPSGLTWESSPTKPHIYYLLRSSNWRKGAFSTFCNEMGGNQKLTSLPVRCFHLLIWREICLWNQWIPVGLCLWGRGCWSRTGPRKLQWLYCKRPPPPVSWVLSAVDILGRSNLCLSFLVSGLFISLFFRWLAFFGYSIIWSVPSKKGVGNLTLRFQR